MIPQNTRNGNCTDEYYGCNTASSQGTALDITDLVNDALGHEITQAQPVQPTAQAATFQAPTRLKFAQVSNALRKKSKQNYTEDFTLECLSSGEYGDAELLHSALSGAMVYDHAEKTWYWYNGLFWEPDKTGSILNLSSVILSELYKRLSLEKHAQSIELAGRIAAADEVDQATRDELAKIQKIVKAAGARSAELHDVRAVNNALEFAKRGVLLGITGDEWDKLQWALPVLNGVIDLKTGELREPDPLDYVRTVSPTIYTGLNTPAPRWDKFLNEVYVTNPTIIAYLRRMFGYSLTGTAQEAIFAVFHGEGGRNGKDVLFSVFLKILGDGIADSVDNSVVLERRGAVSAGGASPHLVKLRGKRLVWASEPDQGVKLTAAQIKLITGGGRITARDVYTREITFDQTWLICLLTNPMPHAPADDAPLWDRVKLIPHDQRFIDNPDPNKPNEHLANKNLKNELFEESSGVLAWLIRGCLEYQQAGLATPECVQMATNEYRDSQDTLGKFLADCCIVRSECSVKAVDLYHAYKKWCEQLNLRPMSGVTFGENMKKRYENKRMTAGQFYLGVGLISPALHDPT